MSAKKGWNPDGYDPLEHNSEQHLPWRTARRRLNQGKTVRMPDRGRRFYLKQRDAKRILARIDNGETEDRYIYPSTRWLRKFRRSNLKGARR